MLATERVRGIMHQHTLPSSRALIQCNLFDCLMQMNGPDRPKSNLSHFSGLNKVWPGRSPQAIKPDDVLRCQTACSRMRAPTVGDGQRTEEHTSELQSLKRTSPAVFSLQQTNPPKHTPLPTK